MRTWILYGANGYTGRLVASRAVEHGLRPVLAGRRPEAIAALAHELGCESKIFPLDDPAQIGRQIEGAAAVLNCAGPFSRTARAMMEACIAARAHYLDITGEIPVIETAAELGDRAASVGVSLIPAVGFDVVPSDCLAAMLATRLPSATHLQLAFAMTGGMSPGTAKTVLEGMPEGGRARINGRIERVPVAWKTLQIPFHDGRRWAMTVPWGDLASGYYSTGIPNIEVYYAMPRRQIAWAKRLRFLLPLVRWKWVARMAERRIERKVGGPTAEERAMGRSSFWGRVSDAHEQDGHRQAVSATLDTPSGYELTVLTAVASLQRVLSGEAPKGFATPSKAFGAEFILSIPGAKFRWETPPAKPPTVNPG